MFDRPALIKFPGVTLSHPEDLTTKAKQKDLNKIKTAKTFNKSARVVVVSTVSSQRSVGSLLVHRALECEGKVDVVDILSKKNT